MDTDRRNLYRGGERVPLKPKAYQLLEYLIQRRPKVVCRQELVDLLWPETYVSPGALHELVYQLRRALHDHDQRIIQTAYAIGFSFAADAGGAPSGSCWLVVFEKHEFDLVEGENLVGRDVDARVRIHDPSVSRRHARITITGDRAMLEDLGSKNGTLLGAQRVHQPVILTDGDRIQFGSILMRIISSASLPSTQTVC